jgi:hypothetical protein
MATEGGCDLVKDAKKWSYNRNTCALLKLFSA